MTASSSPDHAVPTPHAPTADVPGRRRLVRSKRDSVLGGVCGGLARYLGVDPLLLRHSVSEPGRLRHAAGAVHATCDATHWDEVVSSLGLEHLRRHALRQTGLTWMADAGVPVHVLRVIAGHGSLTTTQRYLHPDRRSITDAGEALTAYLRTPRSPSGPRPEAV